MKTYFIFWLSQSVSQLGSAMTGFCLGIWAFEQTGSALTISLMSFCAYMPFVAVSIFAGSFVDRHRKKNIMCIADTLAAVCSAVVFVLLSTDALQIQHIYIVNSILGFANAFQTPASMVAVGIMVPKEQYGRVSGMNSFSTNLVTVVAPMLAGVLLAVVGMKAVLIIDLCSFCIAISVLLFLIKIPEKIEKNAIKQRVFAGIGEGFQFLRQHKALLYIMITMALINFFSRLTYENILSPMILARSGGDAVIFGAVSCCLGIGGIIGGLLVSTGKLPKNNVKLIYYSAALSFLCGDLCMGFGQNVYFWCLAGLLASLPIPFILAGQNVILYQTVPQAMQGRVFAVRNAIQFSTIPIGILLGGTIADYIFEPFMQGDGKLASVLGAMVGTGNGSGMAVMFLCTGVLGTISSIFGYRRVTKANR